MNIVEVITPNVAYSGSNTYYLPAGMGSQDDQVTTANNTQTTRRSACTIKNAAIYLASNSVSNTSTHNLQQNGSNTSIALSIASSTSGEFTDSDSISISAGDELEWQLVNGASAGSMVFNYLSYQVDASSNTMMMLGCGGNLSTSSASTTNYISVAGRASTNSATESIHQYKVRTAGTLKNFNVNVNSNARTTTTTFRVRKNTANGNQVLSVGSTATGIFQDTSNTDTVAANDLINYSRTTGTGTGSIITGVHAVEFETTNSKFFFLNAVGAAVSQNANLTRYQRIAGGLVGNLSTEGVTNQYKVPIALTLSDLGFRVTANTVTASSTATVRNNSASTSITTSIASSTTGYFEDTSHTASIAINDLIGFQIVTGATGTSMSYSIIACTAEAVAVAHSKNLNDTVTIADTASKKPGIALTDSMTMADSKSNKPGVKPSDTMTIADSKVLTVQLNKLDTVIIADSFDRLLVFLRSIDDTMTISDAASKATGKPVTDTMGITDSILATLGRIIALSDTVDIADSQSKVVVKTITDTLILADSLAKVFGLTKSETIGLVDSITKVLGKSLSDTATISDVLIKTAGKSLTDLVIASDALAKVFGLNKADTQTLSDTLIRAAVKNQNDTMTILDVLNKSAQVKPVDTMNLIDSMAKATGKGLSDSMNLSDILSRVEQKGLTDTLTMTDNQNRVYGKALQDNMNVTDLISKQIGKLFTDAVGIVDSMVSAMVASGLRIYRAFEDRIKSKRGMFSSKSSLTNKKDIGENKDDIFKKKLF